MAATLFLLLFTSSLFIPSYTQNLQSEEPPFISVLIFQKGIDFLTNLLVTKAISSITPLRLPTIEKVAKIPFLGNVDFVLSNFTIYDIDVLSSFVKPGDSGITILASGTTCNLSTSWEYEFFSWVLPVEIADQGRASVQVEGLQVGLTLGLVNQNGTLKLSLMDYGCHVEDVNIKLDGGASWLYQGIIDALEGNIGAAVEDTITEKLGEGILKLDSLLQSLPKDIPVDDNASLNVTFVKDPLLSNSSIEFDINGLFTGRTNIPVSMDFLKSSQPSAFCPDPSKMLGISLDEAVFNSASALYYNAKFMQWIVDEIPDQNLLNTARWRFIIPNLYKNYPNDDMDLNISLSSPPIIRISEQAIDATVYADLIIDVLKGDEVIPVVCISLNIRGSGEVRISGNKLGGSVKLNDFSMSLKWSKIGNLHLYLVQPVMWTIIQTVFIPYANAHLGQGFPLPIIHGFTLKNVETIFSDSKIAVCGDVEFTDP
ncbi:lipid-binding serum glycoprotein family protein [Euphorbia peplus]|nr:lipid-binding serum glycoprotein family protein [Euphorbia peplus]